MGRLLFYMFAAFVMALVFMVASSDFIYRIGKSSKASKKENRETFEKDIDDLANKIKNKQ